MNDEPNNPLQEGMPQVESKKLNIWGWLIGIGAFLVIILLVIGALAILHPYIKPYQDTKESVSYPYTIQTQHGLLEKDYSSTEEKVTLTKEDQTTLSEIKLNTPKIYKVGAGYQKVAEIEFTSYEDFKQYLSNSYFELYDKRNGMKPIQRQLDFKYLTTEQVSVDDYSKNCIIITNETGTGEKCTQVKSGSHLENKEVWKDISEYTFKLGEKVRIGIFTDVQIDDNVEWIPTIYGVKIEEWAEWTADLNVGLVAYWKMDETSGILVKDSVGGHNGTLVNSPTSITGKISNAWRFNGIDEEATIPNSNSFAFGTGNFTINFWINRSVADGHETMEKILSGAPYTGWAILTALADGKVYVYLNSGSGVGGTKTINNNQWHMVTLTRNAGNCTVWINATVDNSWACSSASVSNSEILRFARIDTWGEYGAVDLDEIGMWNRSLSDTEISTQLWNGGTGITYTNVFISMSINLVSPENNSNFSSLTNYFVANVTNTTITIKNVSLLINGTIDQTNTSGLSGKYNFTKTLSNSNYNWTVIAYGNDSVRYNATNGTLFFGVDTVAPQINFVTPTENNNTIFSRNWIAINVTATDNNLKNITTILYGSTHIQINSSLTLTSPNFINFTSTDGIYFYNATANDAVGNGNSTETRKITLDKTNPLIEYVSPTPNNNSIVVGVSNLTINISVTETNPLNITFRLFNSTSLVNSTTFLMETQSSNNSITFLNLFPETYTYNSTVFDLASNSNTTTRIFIVQAFENTGEQFESTVLETSRQTFILNVSSGAEFTVQNGRLVYNGTVYSSATKTDLGGGNFSLSHTIFITIGISGFASENRSFFWNLTMANIATGETFNVLTNTQNQTVNELIFGLCSPTRTVPMINFTMYDEGTNQTINATANAVTFQTTFNLGVHWDYKLKNTSVSNLSVNTNKFDFCTNNNSRVFYTNMEALFSADSYTEKNYYLNNATLTNATNKISLYLLNQSDAIEFFITVKDGLDPLTLAIVTISKYFIGEGVYKTVEIDKTNTDDGLFTAYLDLDRRYRFSIIDSDGDFRGVIEKTASCDVAPCTLTILVSETEIADSLFADVFAIGVLYNISYNPTTKMVSFDFIDTTGLATSFKMIITRGSLNETGDIVYDNEIFTSSGSLTANLSAYSSGDFTVKTYIVRSPYQFIDYYFFTISEITEQLGLLGLLVALLIILVIVFGLAYSPPMLVLAVPLALTASKLMGIISVSFGFITLAYILAFIAIISLNR